jgi:Tol biopolymer transport system component
VRLPRLFAAAVITTGALVSANATAAAPKMAIAYSVWEHGHYTLWLMTADGGSRRRLYEGPAGSPARDPAWSPDRTWIAFSGVRRGLAAGSTQILVIRPDGTGLRQLTQRAGADKRSPSWSPDGERIAYTARAQERLGDSVETGTAELRVLNLRTGADTSIVSGPYVYSSGPLYEFVTAFPSYPAWSPRSDQILFALQPEYTSTDTLLASTLARVNADGTGLTLMPQLGRAGLPSWAPDGQRFSFVPDGDAKLHVANADGSGDRAVTDGACSAGFSDWAPDGRSIAFTCFSQHRHVYSVSASGGASRPLTRGGSDELTVSWRG